MRIHTVALKAVTRVCTEQSATGNLEAHQISQQIPLAASWHGLSDHCGEFQEMQQVEEPREWTVRCRKCL